MNARSVVVESIIAESKVSEYTFLYLLNFILCDIIKMENQKVDF